jgi:hypothetical protein
MNGDEQGSAEEISRPRKRKKKKQKQSQASAVSFFHIALVIGGLFVVALATGIFFMIQHGGGGKGRSKHKPDPELFVADLQALGAQVKRDTTSPGQPVIEIRIISVEYNPKMLSDLDVFPQLRRLSLAGTPTTDVWLEWLEDITSLTALDLGHTKVTGGGMQFLKKMVNLEELTLDQTLVDDVRLMELKGCKKLKRIYLTDTLATGLPLKEAIPDLKIYK